MANMSYCRFHNTNLDLQDCLYALNDALEAKQNVEWLETYEDASDDELEEARQEFREMQLSVSEASAAREMISRFLDAMTDLCIIDGCDYNAMNDLISSISK